MDFKFDGGAKGSAPQGQDKGRQTALLVLLLLLLGGFGYLYFFTNVIRPQQGQPPAAQAVPQVVKQPLPARDGVQPQISSATQPDSPAPPAESVAEQASASPGAADQPSAQPAAVAPTAPAATAKPAVQKPAAAAKPVPTPAAKDESAKPEPAAKPAAAPKVAVKKAPTPKPMAKQQVVAKVGGPWTVVVGNYVLEEKLAADMARVKAIGLTPVMTSGQRHLTTMHRLKYADYTDREAALRVVELLKHTAGDGFAVQRGGKHEVYVGSYAQLSGAQEEQRRLASAGITVSIQKSQVGVPSRKLTAGTYTDRAVAESTLKKLKQAGIGTPVLE